MILRQINPFHLMVIITNRAWRKIPPREVKELEQEKHLEWKLYQDPRGNWIGERLALPLAFVGAEGISVEELSMD